MCVTECSLNVDENNKSIMYIFFKLEICCESVILGIKPKQIYKISAFTLYLRYTWRDISGNLNIHYVFSLFVGNCFAVF